MKLRDALASILAFIIIALILFFLAEILFPSTGNIEYTTVYITKGQLFKGFFTEPFETLLLEFEDGDFLTFSTHHPYHIYVTPWYVKDFVEKEGKELENCIRMIHNHLIPIRFTPGNNYFAHWMRTQGFKGLFQIYYPFNNRVITLEI